MQCDNKVTQRVSSNNVWGLANGSHTWRPCWLVYGPAHVFSFASSCSLAKVVTPCLMEPPPPAKAFTCFCWTKFIALCLMRPSRGMPTGPRNSGTSGHVRFGSYPAPAFKRPCTRLHFDGEMNKYRPKWVLDFFLKRVPVALWQTCCTAPCSKWVRLHLPYCVGFRTNNLRKGMNLLIFPAME